MDRIMAVASSWDFWLIPLAIAVVIVVIFGGFRARSMVLCAGLAIGLTDGVVVDSLKNLVGRPRPNVTEAGLRVVDLAKAKPRLLAIGKPLQVKTVEPGILPQRGPSFPSGHASNNFCVATVVAMFYRRWGWLMFLPATLVSISRIYVGSHWPSDVIISALIGSAVAFFTLAAAATLWKRWGGRMLPRLHQSHPDLLPA